MSLATSAGASQHASQISLLKIVLFAFTAILPGTVVLAATSETPADNDTHPISPVRSGRPRYSRTIHRRLLCLVTAPESAAITWWFGAFTADGAVSQSGAAYVFEGREGQWIQLSKLLANDGVSFDAFGESIAMDGDTNSRRDATFRFVLPNRQISMTIAAPGYSPWTYIDAVTGNNFLQLKSQDRKKIVVELQPLKK